MDNRNIRTTINLSESAGVPEPAQKQRGTVTPKFKNKWRNKLCACGSGIKAKRCCGPRLTRMANMAKAAK